ncbi:4-hydroxyphenylacetate 3-monooxygenase, oxygenase component [Paenibacillus cineris]|uniref:4-hydroxyphenylacetate 3-monooxygenase n=1 Tax=Paenibacillus cineris TaxID=237530 RepID=A0ABQ4LFW3_9BACL|nr:4-hydroxyphenylacetate 3-monooxygenase, oxygenase component [Paenibacillus cineris]GIO55170.1 putative 4-hydroxyphenylacetate 3-monooxygenase [Paenibacillus cineris]
MPVKNGKEYIERIDQAQPEVWLRGKKIQGKLSDHAAFRGLMSTQASLYDMQVAEEYAQLLTYTSPETGEPVGLSYLQPKTKEDLARRRSAMTLWGERHFGLLGRSPDYMNTAVMAYAAASELLAEADAKYADNMRNYYRYCSENDITLSHAFVQPAASRTAEMLDDGTIVNTAARIVDQTTEGVIVSGAFLLATQGVTADEILVYPPASFVFQEEDNPETFAFAVPNNLPGMKWISRESLVGGDSGYDYPLSSRFEEMDTLVIFDHVLVPWERIFILGNDSLSIRFFAQSGFHVHAAHQVCCRYVAKTEFVLGIILSIVDALERNGGVVTEQVTEVIVNLELLKALLLASEAGAKVDRWGSMMPDYKPLWSAAVVYPQMYARMMEIIQLLGSSSVIMIPSEQDFEAPGIATYLSAYLKGSSMDARDKTALFRLAWELSSSGFGGRQQLYERFFFGGQQVTSNRLFQGYLDKEKYKERVQQFLRDL